MSAADNGPVHVLVLQWSAGPDAYDDLIAMEDLLERALPARLGDVDGHDLGAGEMNLFVMTDSPGEAFEIIRTTLDTHPRWPTVRVAFRHLDDDLFTPLWPADLTDFTVA